MSESDPSPEQLGAIIRQLIDSLRAAGVEWLPQAEDLPAPARRPEPVADAATPGRIVTLFDGTDTLPAETATLTVEERLKELTVLRERVAIVKMSGKGLKPGETRSFRLPFDSIPSSWNQALPQLVIARIEFAE